MLPSLNDKLGGFSFGTTADGKPGYRKPGADAVTPFSSTNLLWENNTISIFTEQTVPLSLENYDGIIIAFTGKLNWTSKWYFYIPKNVSQGCNVYMGGDATNQTGSDWGRIVTPTNTGVTIGMSSAKDDSGCIPRQIYGVQGM